MVGKASLSAIVMFLFASSAAHGFDMRSSCDAQLVRRAFLIFPWASQGQQRAQWMAQHELSNPRWCKESDEKSK